MKKKIFYLIGVMMLLLGVKNVNAESIYVNANNVEMDYELYQELSEIYSKNYMEFITQERYNEFKETDLSKIEIREYIEQPIIQPLSAINETEYKILKFIKQGNIMTLHLKWKKMPSTRSYDVLGIRTQNVALNGIILSKQVYKKDGQLYNNDGIYKTFSNGFGVTFKLPEENITELEEYVDFKYNGTGNGNIYGTYQHAQKSLTLAESKSYTISSTGLGKVLNFSNNTITDKFDKMTGIDIIA